MKQFLLYVVIFVASSIGAMAILLEETAELGIGVERALSGLSSKTVVVDGETWHYLEGGPKGASQSGTTHCWRNAAGYTFS